MTPGKVPANLPDLVRTTFNRAKANGDLNFYPTQVAVLKPASTPIQLRFAPALANKPKAPPPPSSSNSPSKTESERAKPFNPFEDPPPALIVTRVEPDHVLVLNKFAIVPEHALLITRTFKYQTRLLEAGDLAATWACIRAYTHDAGNNTSLTEGQGLFAFFNCGEHSGASQPHRHLQLLPVARMRDGLQGDDAAAWGVLADQLVGADERQVNLPFLVFGERLSPDMEAEDLRAVYLRLYRKACAAAGAGQGPSEEELAAVPDGIEARISYNMVMTRQAMVLCPRTAEGGPVLDGEGREVGKVAFNGTVMAGTALVKTQAEWDALKGDPEQVWEILTRIGLKV